MSKITLYSKNQSVPIISYTYTIHIATKIFNCQKVLYDLNIIDFKSKHPDCICARSPFIYNPAGHVLTDDHNIINNISLRDVFAKRPICCEPKCINRKQFITILMDSVEDYARQ